MGGKGTREEEEEEEEEMMMRRRGRKMRRKGGGWTRERSTQIIMSELYTCGCENDIYIDTLFITTTTTTTTTTTEYQSAGLKIRIPIILN